MLPFDAGVLCAPTASADGHRRRDDRAPGCQHLVLVHRTELAMQWQERLQAFLSVGKGVVGTIGGGGCRPAGSTLP